MNLNLLNVVSWQVIVKIACGDSHTAAVSDEGKMLVIQNFWILKSGQFENLNFQPQVWGKAKYGQLGTGDTAESKLTL